MRPGDIDYEVNLRRGHKGFPAKRNLSLIAFDPGATTGVCFVSRGEPFAVGTLAEYEMLEWSVGNRVLVPEFPDFVPEVFVVEEWRLFPGKSRPMFGNIFTPSQVIGMIRSLAYRNRVPLHFQQASLKAFITPEKLAFYGWANITKSEHERDACRHALYYMTATNVPEIPEIPEIPSGFRSLRLIRSHMDRYDEEERKWILRK